ncbi:MAG: DUF1580 domain-containing protein [Planctomycetota bacterium]
MRAETTSHGKNQSPLRGERLLAIQEVPDELPRRRGKKLHISTVYRWAHKGCRGKVLETALLGGVRYTSLEALARFMATEPPDTVEAKRRAEINAAIRRRGLA